MWTPKWTPKMGVNAKKTRFLPHKTIKYTKNEAFMLPNSHNCLILVPMKVTNPNLFIAPNYLKAVFSISD